MANKFEIDTVVGLAKYDIKRKEQNAEMGSD